uniref:Peptidase S8/S53 domain-containing protein n=1 Tax=Panagrolaimus sp. ES5 TaxID=591445 RepID=A0AC34FUI0_9BILA
LPLKWKNPSGEWHLGCIDFEKLCPKRKTDEKENNNVIYLKRKKTSEKFEIEMKMKLRPNNDIVDCIVWFDGEKWQACLDFSFSKDLQSAKILTNFRDCYEYDLIFDRISYSIEICLNGNLLKIFLTHDNHGSNVAQIAAANFPDEPHKNGLAPGAQIISMNVSKGEIIFTESLKEAVSLKVDSFIKHKPF